jgi:MGT family glycosyltransferase
MTSAKIAVFTHPSRGHLNPVLETCSLLRQRGHEVTCAVTRELAPAVTDAGAQPIVYEITDSRSPAIRERAEQRFRTLNGFPHQPLWWNFFAEDLFPAWLDMAAGMLEQVQSFYAANPPDVVLYDRVAFGGRVVAARAGAKTVQLYPHFVPYDDSLYRVRGVCVRPEPMRQFSTALDAFFASHGISETDNLWHTAGLNISFLPREFQHHAEHLDERFVFAGTCLNRSFKPGWKNTSGGKPIVLYTGMLSGFLFEPLVEALGNRNYHLVVSAQTLPQETYPKALPDNVEVCRSASQLELLQHASVVVCYGGTGTTLEALYHGLPVIVSPKTPTTAETCYRVMELGVGDCIPRDQLSANAVRDSVDGVLTDASMQRRVQQIQRVFKESGGAALAVDRIERYLGSQD